ncbi:MAG: hypothetical protein FJ139_02580 [Deltaproteobacteria bacterium]|nr:hypothetical protein [Deltaproteobacteria bacterium]
MNAKVYFTGALLLCFVVSGCTMLRYFDDSSSEEIKKFEMSKDQMWNEMKKLRQENESYKQTLGSKREEINQLNRQVADLNKEVEKMKSEVERMAEVKTKEPTKGEVQEAAVTGQIAAVKEKEVAIEKPEVKEGASQVDAVKKEEVAGKETAVPMKERGIDIKNLRVKVLSGTGKMSSARVMAKKLTGMGYRIASVDMAPRKNFTTNTVFYAPDYRNEARDLTARLGENAVCKPLTWSSVFHIIVVSVQ